MSENPVSRSWRRILTTAMVGLLAACGGSSGGYMGAEASGIWFGYWGTDGFIDAIPFVMIARGNTELYLDSEYQLLIGNGQTEGNAFSATAMGYQYGMDYANGTLFSLNGEVHEGSSLNGAHSRTGVSGTFGLDYVSELSSLTASLSSIADTYTDAGFWIREGRYDATLTINADGSLNGSSDGCVLDGDVGLLDRSRNIYSWSAAATGCAVNGQASGIGFGLSGGGATGIYLVGLVNGSAISISAINESPVAAMKIQASEPGRQGEVLRALLARLRKGR